MLELQPCSVMVFGDGAWKRQSEVDEVRRWDLLMVLRTGHVRTQKEDSHLQIRRTLCQPSSWSSSLQKCEKLISAVWTARSLVLWFDCLSWPMKGQRYYFWIFFFWFCICSTTWFMPLALLFWIFDKEKCYFIYTDIPYLNYIRHIVGKMIGRSKKMNTHD
jgi:hypothetical protein